MTAVLVTGGAGYIGSHCAMALAKAGYQPIVYDNFSTGHRDFVRWGPHVEGDIRDRDKLKTVFNQYQPIAVMHLAGLISVGESVKYPERYYDVNVTGTLTLLESMIEAGVESIVFSSSAAVYGEPDSVPISEDAPLEPNNPYGMTKLECERLMDDMGAAHSLRSVRLRYFNAAGADPEGTIGEHHDPETHLIPLLLDAAMGRRESVKIYGNDYPTPDGTAIRDYIHVMDLAEAHVSALIYLLSGGDNLAVNLGTGRGYSVKEVLEETFKVVGRNFQVENAPRRSGDSPSLIAEPNRAREVLNWQAALPDIKTMIANAWRWHQKRF